MKPQPYVKNDPVPNKCEKCGGKMVPCNKWVCDYLIEGVVCRRCGWVYWFE